jgi:hypothetical protein
MSHRNASQRVGGRSESPNRKDSVAQCPLEGTSPGALSDVNLVLKVGSMAQAHQAALLAPRAAPRACDLGRQSRGRALAALHEAFEDARREIGLT